MGLDFIKDSPGQNIVMIAGLKVILGIVGKLDDVIKAYQTRDLKGKRFLMPGCYLALDQD